MVAQRGEDEEFAESAEDAQPQRERLLLHRASRRLPPGRHEPPVQTALQPGRVPHLDLDGGDQVLPDSRRRHDEVRADLAQVLEHRFRTLRAVDRAADDERAGERPERVADPGRGQIGEHLVGPAIVLDLEDSLDRVDEVGVRDHGALRGAGGAGSVADQRHVFRFGRPHQLLEQAGPLAVELPSQLFELLEAHEERVGVVAEPLGVLVDHLRDLGQASLELEDLVHLLLVLGEDDLRVGVIDDVVDLPRDGVLEDGHGNPADDLRRDHAGVHLRAVVAQDGELVVAPEPQAHQAEGEGADVSEIVRQGPRLPDALLLLPERRRGRILPRVLEQELGQRHLRHGLASYAGALVPRYALITWGFALTSAGVPSAIFSPRSRTTTRWEMSMTTPMSCSMRMIVVPHSSLTSRMKRAMSSFSSWFVPPIGSSSSNTLGWRARARPSSTRFWSPYGSEPTGRLRMASISRKSMMSSTTRRCSTSSRRPGPQ